MKSELIKKDGCEVEFSIEATQEEISALEQATIREFSSSANIRGFRSGKAPQKVVIRMYKNQIEGQIIQKTIEKHLESTLEELDISPICQPVLKNIDFELGSPLSLKIVTEILPEFELKDWKGFKLEKLSEEVTEKDEEEAISQFLEYNARFETIDDRPLQKGDMGIFDLKVSQGGDVLEEKESHWLELNDKPYFTGLVEETEEMNIGDSKSFTTQLPKEHYLNKSEEEIEVTVDLKLGGIRVKEIPELTDEYIKNLGQKGCETVDEYKKRLREHLEQTKKEQSESHLKNQISDQLIASYDFDLPKSLVQSQAEKNYKNQVQNLRSQHHLPEDQIEVHKDAIWKTANEMAQKQLKLQLIQSKIIKTEKIEASDEELKATLEEEAKKIGIPSEQFESLLKAQKRLDFLKEKVIEDKLNQLIISNGNVENK